MTGPFKHGITAALLALSVMAPWARAQTPYQLTVAQQAYSLGTYSGLLGRFHCPQDQKKYGHYFEDGKSETLDYCEQEIPAGYWVYQAPHWYVYRQLKRPTELERASVSGKYAGLIAKIDCPAEREENRNNSGQFDDYGYETATAYCGQDYPDAYWVWLDPYWYVWKDKDISKIGFSTQRKKLTARPPVRLNTVTLTMDYAQENSAWAQETLNNLEQGILAMESWSGKAFPGEQPFPIEERPNFEVLGLAGKNKMSLVSPPQGTPWTLLHEMTHVWNVDVEPLWYNEGHANFVSYLLMKELNLPFYGEETLKDNIAEWQALVGTDQDYPLQGHYNQLPQGKAMAFWKMMYELGGAPLIRASFLLGLEKTSVSLQDLRQLIQQHIPGDPERFLSGWILPGDYQVKSAQDLGPIKYPLP